MVGVAGGGAVELQAPLETARPCRAADHRGSLQRGEGTHSGFQRSRAGATASRPQCVPKGWFGRITPGSFYRHREGVYRDEATNTDLFFITLEKSEREYSPSTLYKDYAISPELVHWESQSTTSLASTTGQRYIHHVKNGSNILLFVRQRRLAEWGTAPYTLLGPAEYVSHTGERPIQFVWRLRRPMPADFFRQAKVATA